MTIMADLVNAGDEVILFINYKPHLATVEKVTGKVYRKIFVKHGPHTYELSQHGQSRGSGFQSHKEIRLPTPELIERANTNEARISLESHLYHFNKAVQSNMTHYELLQLNNMIMKINKKYKGKAEK